MSKCDDCFIYNNDVKKWLVNHDKQIRDETIDEFVQKFNSCVPTKNCRDKDCAECVAEQMKGEQNEGTV